MQGGHAAESPLDALAGCHRHLATLLARLEPLLGHGTADRERRLQIYEIVTDLDKVLGTHMQDEERDVFPVILAVAHAPDRHGQAFALVSGLLVEHREMMETWSRLRIGLRARSAGLSGPPVEEEARAFIAHVRRHLDREDREFGDLLRTATAAQLAEMALAMARRQSNAGCLGTPTKEKRDAGGASGPAAQ